MVTMKILLVHNAYCESGGEDVAFDAERRLLESAGHQVVIYRRTNEEIETYSGFERLALVSRVVWAKDARQDIAALLRQEKPQLAHMHNTFMMVSPSVYSACREVGVPVVQTLHNYRLLCPAANFFRKAHVCEECVEHSLWRGIRHGCYRDSRPATMTVALMLALHRRWRTWMEMVNGYIALTEFARQKFISGGLPADNVSVKPNFVHPDPGERAGSGEYALFVGRLAPEKGLHILLASWERLHNSLPLHVVGDGPMRTRLEAQAVECGLANILFRGRLTRSAVWEAIKGAKFLILPSECYENFPVTVAEAFACGIPVICSRHGAMQEIVSDSRTGLHFTPGSPEDLAQKVEWASTHPGRMAEMGKEARREYESRYASERNYSLLMEIYRRVLAAGCAGGA
jgi:glycosyltransferase involved in cell wall biosynthesis